MTRPETALHGLRTDPHSPPQFRVAGTVGPQHVLGNLMISSDIFVHCCSLSRLFRMGFFSCFLLRPVFPIAAGLVLIARLPMQPSLRPLSTAPLRRRHASCGSQSVSRCVVCGPMDFDDQAMQFNEHGSVKLNKFIISASLLRQCIS